MDLSRINRLLFPSKQAPEPERKYSPSPSPYEIVEANVPGKNYQGLKVDWKLYISNMQGEISRNEVLILTSFGSPRANIWLVIDAGKYPEIYQYSTGCRLAVKGEITSVRDADIYVKDCQIELIKY